MADASERKINLPHPPTDHSEDTDSFSQQVQPDPPSDVNHSANNKREGPTRLLLDDQGQKIPIKQHRSPIVTLGLIALAVSLILLSLGGAYSFFHKNTNQDFSNMTTTAVITSATNTAVAMARVHAYATTSAIITHSETATALANTSQYPFSYTPHLFQLRDVFTDLFKQHTNNNNWDDNDQCRLRSIGYLVASSSPNHATTCFAANTQFSNFTYEVHFQIRTGDCAGIIFRASNDEKNFYSFIVCQDGSYEFVSSSNGSLNNPSRTGTSSGVQKGLNSYNTIGVVARGNNLSFYVYKDSSPTFMFSVRDNNFSQGRIGVIVDSLHNKLTQAIFLGAKVWTL